MANPDTENDKLRRVIDQIRSARPNPEKLKSLIEEFESKSGPETEEQVLEIIAETTREAWSQMAERIGNNGIDGILDTLWSSFEKIGGEFTIERKANSAQIRCTKCPIADTYLEIGKPEYGLIFHCSTDPHIVTGFNPNMEFKITKRLMSGDDCCDHYYCLK